MKQIYYLITIITIITIASCDSSSEVENISKVANLRSMNSNCNGFGGGCLPNCHIETNDDTGEITLTFTPNETYSCTNFHVSYTGTSIGNAWLSLSNNSSQDVKINDNGYTYVQIEVSCTDYNCTCSRYYMVEAGEKPEDIGPIEIGTNCGREYYSHSFECINGKLYIFCNDSEYDEYDPEKNPFKMVIDSYTTRIHIPGDEDDNSNFPDGGGYILGDPIELNNIYEGYATVYFYSSQCKYPEQHCYYITYNWMDDVEYINNVHVNETNSHPTY